MRTFAAIPITHETAFLAPPTFAATFTSLHWLNILQHNAACSLFHACSTMLPSTSSLDCADDNSNLQLLQYPYPPSKRRRLYGEPSPMGIGRKIFLSHSGCDKRFVRFLQQALKDRSYDAFYDEETLPKAVAVSMRNILDELPSCELGVLVLSDDFFEKTPNPMRELAAMVANKVRLLPLFYKLSVPQFKEESRRARWMHKWREEWHIPQDVLVLWTEALGTMGTFNGVEMCIEATNEVTYIDKIVCAVCEALPLAIRWSDEHVQGMDRLCQIVAKMYTSVNHYEEHDSIDEHSDALVVGMHGFGGVGKSTLCKALCDFYFSLFHGRVCLIDLGSSVDTNDRHQSQTTYATGSAGLNRLTTVLSTLTNFKVPHNRLHHSQLQNVLRERIRCGSNPLFLVIDNVQATEESKHEAEFYLNCRPFPGGSKIFITSRSADTLRVLIEPHKFSVVEAFPDLMFHEARSIFLAKASPALCNYNADDPLKINDHALSPEQNAVVDECVKMCTLHRLTDQCALYADYHPLLLISFASFLRVQSLSSDPLKWKSSIADVESQGRGIKGLERVNGMLQKSFELLDEQEQAVFIDLALYKSSTSIQDAQQWLECVYNCQSFNIRQSLSKLRALSFIADQGSRSAHMHDLLISFATKKAEGHPDYIYKEDSHCFPDDITRQLQDADIHNAPAAARCRTRVTISRCRFKRPYSRLDLSSWHSIEVLHLLHNQGLEKVLVSSSSLRSLVVQPVATNSHFETEIIVVDQGSWPWQRQLQIYNGRIRWLVLGNCKIETKTSRLPWPLAYRCNLRAFKDLVHLHMRMVQAFDLGSVGELPHLETLDLSYLPVKTGLRLDTCTSLKEIRLHNLPHLEFISGLEKSTNMSFVSLLNCHKLRSLHVLDKAMVEFGISNCALERIDIHPAINVAITEVGRPGYGGNITEESELLLNYLGSCPRMKKIRDDPRLPTEFEVDLACDRAMEETFQEMVQESASIYTSRNCRARILSLSLTGGSGPAGLTEITITDAQNICHFIWTLHVADVRRLGHLDIACKEGAAAGGCGCDTDPPLFGLLHKGLTNILVYSCSRVKDVSSLGNCKLIETLELDGCGSVEHWPNFANMTSLILVSLSETSLAQWPQGLFSLGTLRVHGCIKLTEHELLEVITKDKTGPVCAIAMLKALKLDLHTHKRSRYAVAESIRSHMIELISIIGEASIFCDASEIHKDVFANELGELVYELWNTEETTSNFLHIADMSCRGAEIISCIKPLLTDPMIIRSFVRPLCRLLSERRWKVARAMPSQYVEASCWEIFRLGENDQGKKVGHLGLVLIGLLSIGSCWFDAASVDEYTVDEYFIPIVKSFADRAELSEKMYGLLEFKYSRHSLSYDTMDSLVNDRWRVLDHEQLSVSIADAVCKLARVPKVAAKLGEEFMLHVIHPLEARVEQDYATYLSRVIEMGIPKPLYNYGYGYYHWDEAIQSSQF